MSVPEVIVSREARADARECFLHIGSVNPDAAERFLAAIIQAYERVASHPGIGSPCEFLVDILAGVRRWRVSGFPNYLIFYRMRAGSIEILRVLHGARNIEKVLMEEGISFGEEG